MLSIIAWSVYRRLFRGKEGLPPGPYGALPAVEGLSYAALIGGIVVVSVQVCALTCCFMRLQLHAPPHTVSCTDSWQRLGSQCSKMLTESVDRKR